jgi:hypothetical protein
VGYFSFLNTDPIFGFSALSGTLLFVIQFFLNFLLGGQSDDVSEGGGEIDSGKVKWLFDDVWVGRLDMQA